MDLRSFANVVNRIGNYGAAVLTTPYWLSTQQIDHGGGGYNKQVALGTRSSTAAETAHTQQGCSLSILSTITQNSWVKQTIFTEKKELHRLIYLQLRIVKSRFICKFTWKKLESPPKVWGFTADTWLLLNLGGTNNLKGFCFSIFCLPVVIIYCPEGWGGGGEVFH